ncbi:MAG: hypothetical protein VW496_01725 [Pelagibacteraceae bacterium]
MRITKHFSGKTYNVDLVAWERNGSGMSIGKAFNVSRKKAEKEANRVAKLYQATIEEK